MWHKTISHLLQLRVPTSFAPADGKVETDATSTPEGANKWEDFQGLYPLFSNNIYINIQKAMFIHICLFISIFWDISTLEFRKAFIDKPLTNSIVFKPPKQKSRIESFILYVAYIAIVNHSLEVNFLTLFPWVHNFIHKEGVEDIC